jgi:hypothetical protein
MDSSSGEMKVLVIYRLEGMWFSTCSFILHKPRQNLPCLNQKTTFMMNYQNPHITLK